jgi:hypothetical protein
MRRLGSATLTLLLAGIAFPAAAQDRTDDRHL